ncbi:GNAT family N-acetyltransferase [Elusimicrobiota bacterium]
MGKGSVPGKRAHRKPGGVLEARRLHLRPLAEADAEALFEAVEVSRDALKRRLCWVSDVQSVEDERRFVSETASPESVWGIFENRAERFVGVTALLGMDDPERAQGRFGIWIRSDRQDKGYAVEAGRMVIEHAFRKAGLHRVYARLDPSNRPYRKALKKLGLRYEGCLRADKRLNGRWVDQECWGLLKSEWKA